MPEAKVSLLRAVTGRMLLSTVGGAGVQVQNVNGGGDWLGAMFAPGIVSRVTPVHTAVRGLAEMVAMDAHPFLISPRTTAGEVVSL